MVGSVRWLALVTGAALILVGLLQAGPGAAAPIKLNIPLPDGSRTGGKISPDGKWVVYLTHIGSQMRLYSVPITGGTSNPLHGTLPGYATVDSVTVSITPDSTRVIFRADIDVDNRFELYSAPIGGGAAVKLNDTLKSTSSGVGHRVTPDGTRAVYIAYEDLALAPNLSVASVTGGATRLVPGVSGRFQSGIQISPASSHVVFSAGASGSGITHLYSIPLGGGQPVTLTQRAGGGYSADFNSVRISPDSDYVYFVGNQISPSIQSLYRVPIDGGPLTVVNAPLAANERIGSGLQVAPTGHVVYTVLNTTSNRQTALYSVSPGGGSTTLLASDFTSLSPFFSLSPDGSRVVFDGTPAGDNASGLFSVPTGGGGLTRLSRAVAPGGSGPTAGGTAAITPDGSRVVYYGDEDGDKFRDLFSIPIDGGQLTTLTGPDLGQGVSFDGVVGFTIAPNSTHVAYLGDTRYWFQRELYMVPITGGPSVKLNGPIVEDPVVGSEGVFGPVLFSPDATRLVYVAAQDSSTRWELYSVETGLGAFVPTPTNTPPATPTAILSLSSTGPVGLYANPGNQSPNRSSPISVTITGRPGVSWQAATQTSDGKPWLKVIPDSGIITGEPPPCCIPFSGSDSPAIQLDARTLLTGTYQGTVTFSSSEVTNAPITATVVMTVIEKPLVFVHGVSGSRLLEPGLIFNGVVWPCCVLGEYDLRRALSLYPGDSHPEIVVGDAIRTAYGFIKVYEPLLTFLTGNGFREYLVDEKPERRTAAGCDVAAQQAARPNLFVYAYDWRRDNAESARLLREYVACLQRFYPGSKLNILTHSMGGLVARRYLLDHPGDHQVDTMITLAAPWLGAPKVTNVLETGDFSTDLISTSDMEYLVGAWPGPQQLAASRGYFALSALPTVREQGWDRNQNGVEWETYTDYDSQFVPLLTRAYGQQGFDPGFANRAFHDFASSGGSQDDWRGDPSGVRYYHVTGNKSVSDTIGTVSLLQRVKCVGGADESQCVAAQRVDLSFTAGDGTVPLVSAERRGRGLDYNAPAATIRRFESTASATDSTVEHTDITKNPAVQAYLLEKHQASNARNGPPLAAESPSVIAATLPANYLLLDGATAISVTDSLGRGTSGDSRFAGSSVPGVSAYQVSANATQLILAGGSTYTVTFRTTSDLLGIELDIGDGATSTRMVRYRDLSLPPTVTGRLVVTASGMSALRYDGNGDGTLETDVQPTAAASGSAVDTEAPVVTATTVSNGSQATVTISATDAGSGVVRLLISLDGRSYVPYAGPITVNRLERPVIYAFADDALANRSGLLIYAVERGRISLPIAGRGLAGGW